MSGRTERPEGGVALPDVATLADGVEGVFRGPVDLAGLEAEIAAVDARLEGPARHAEIRRVAGRHGVAAYFADQDERRGSGRILVVDVERPEACAVAAIGGSDELATYLAAVRREQAEERARRGWSRGSFKEANRRHENRLRQFAKRR